MERARSSRVTGSRPSEIPLRVQDSNRQSMYTTPRNKQPSFGKLNIPRPQNGTSERRTSFFGPRTSWATMPRNSTISTFGGNEKLKDTRPLHDKSYVQQCIKQLHEFLTDQGFPGPLSSKTLHSPSTKEFLKIFEFLYCQLDPTFAMPKSKAEEEVPVILRVLRYPFVLSKSSIYSVGAPHTWPQALAALTWLIDNIKIKWSLGNQELLFTEFPEERGNIEEGAKYHKLLMDYTGETYSKFMQGDDVFDDDDEIFLNRLKKLYNVDEALLAEMEAKHHKLTEEVKQLERESHTDRLMSKRMDKVKLQSDLQKLQSFRSNLESFEASLQSKATEVKEELENNGSHLENLKHERDELQNVLRNQKFTPADVERINREKRELQQTIDSLSKSLEDAQQHQWNEEIALAKSNEKLDMKVTEYHKLARKLKLIPSSAENACGHDFTIRPLESGPVNMQRLQALKILLRKLISDVEEECIRSDNRILSLEDTCGQLNSNIMDKSSELKQLSEHVRKLDEQLESDMQELAIAEKEWEAEIESVQNHRKILEKKVTFGYDQAVQQLKATQQQYHLVVQETNEGRRTVANNLASVFTAAANHLSITEKCLEDLHLKVHGVVSKAVEDDKASIQKLKETLQDFKRKASSLKYI
ncbi:kinetochore protein NDC80 homolog [Neosynchiropus ocellatus]